MEMTNIFLCSLRSFAVNKLSVCCGLFLLAGSVWAQQAGGIRGTVCDREDNMPLSAAQVTIVQTGAKTVASDEGTFVFGQVDPGKYTLVFSKDGYTRQVSSDVVVSDGQMADVNALLTGEYTEMDEFVVQKLATGGGTEEGLLNLRMESSALMDSVGTEAMSRAGASDAAGALRLVAGASVQDGKYAVVRGLPDRYVSSQMNSVRLPTADADKRAVQLDQFASALIDSIQISKTFTPDQQGDASGGAVNVVLKGIPDQRVLNFKVGTEYNSGNPGDNFLGYKSPGIDYWGKDDGSRRLPVTPAEINSFDAIGVSRKESPVPYSWTATAGNKHEFDNGIRVGGLGSFNYKHSMSYYEGGVDDKYSVQYAANGSRIMVPTGVPTPGSDPSGDNPFRTSLFDVTKGSEQVQWGGLGAVGVEVENHALTLLYMQTQATEEKATLLEDTRGNAMYGNSAVVDRAPYHRREVLDYQERNTETLQLRGTHTLSFPEYGLPGYFVMLPPEVDWTVAQSSSGLYSPDKRQFTSWWYPSSYNGLPPLDSSADAAFVQRIWKDINEESSQYFVNGKQPFEQWNNEKGYFKAGIFKDAVKRTYDQDSFSNPGDYQDADLDWDELWSSVFTVNPAAPLVRSPVDVDYKGQQDISAYYYMLDMPLTSFFKVTGGARYESTDLSIINTPDASENGVEVNWFSHEQNKWVSFVGNEDEVNVTYQRDDVLPSLGFELKPVKSLTLRTSYSETIARQTFKELSPIMQMEYYGGDAFVGNPNLEAASVKNYDLRADYTPVEGSLVSLSWFQKNLADPIEYVQRSTPGGIIFSTPVNYPEGTLTGYELEFRQKLDKFWAPLDGLSAGANATFIQSEVMIPDNEIQDLINNKGIVNPSKTRDMMNAPEYLYNVNLTYDIKKTGTQFGLFYTVRGDTLVVGDGGILYGAQYAPAIYETEYGTLSFNISQKIGKRFKLTFQAKNLNDPEIQQVYRSDYITGGDTIKTSYRKGIDYSISLGGEF